MHHGLLISGIDHTFSLRQHYKATLVIYRNDVTNHMTDVAVNRKPLEIANPPYILNCGGTDVRDLEQTISVSVPVVQWI